MFIPASIQCDQQKIANLSNGLSVSATQTIVMWHGPTFLDIMSDFFSQVWPKCHWWQSMLQNTARALLRKNNFNIWAIEVNLTPHGNLTPPEASKVAIGESYSSTMFKAAFSQQKYNKKGTRLAKLYYYPYSIEQVQLISHNLFWKKISSKSMMC